MQKLVLKIHIKNSNLKKYLKKKKKNEAKRCGPGKPG